MLLTPLPSKSKSFASQPSISEAYPTIFARSFSQAFSTAFPVTYVVLEAYEPESYGEVSVSAPETAMSSTSHSRQSAAICASIVSQPVPMSAAAMLS